MRPVFQQAAAAFRSIICACHLIAPPLGRAGYALINIICNVCKKVNVFSEEFQNPRLRVAKQNYDTI